MACSDDSERERQRDRVRDRGRAAPLLQGNWGSPGRGRESMSVGVGTCAVLLGYSKVLCPSPLSHWIHVTTPGCVKGIFKSPHPPAPPPSSSPASSRSDSCRRLIEIMADSCETKHSISAVYDIKEAAQFSASPAPSTPYPLFFFPASLSFAAWVIVSGSTS